MMNDFMKLAALVVFLYVLQTSMLPLIAYHGISPDLLLLLTVSFAFLRGIKQGVLMGFAAGLLQDLATGTFLGMNAFTHTIFGLICGQLSESVFKEIFLLPVLSSIAVTIANYFILAVLMVLLGYRFNLMGGTEVMLVPMLIYQLAFAYPVHRLVYAVDKQLQNKDKH